MEELNEIEDIQIITEHCLKLLTFTEHLRREESMKQSFDLTEELFPSLRKLFIATLMRNKYLICISGLQGAGKTTLMKNFYGIDDEFMNVSLGRGERVPVLITEDDVTETHMKALVIEKNDGGSYYQKEIELDKKQIIQATKGEESKIMYLELVVPYKHTKNNGVSFMLLPGFEKKNEYWGDLIEFSVNSSDAAVFVFSESSLSNAENEEYLARIEKTFETNVVYAISGSDVSNDNNAETKQTCMEVLKISKEEEDRVVCVGQYSEQSKNDAWIKLFKEAINKYALGTDSRKKSSKYIYEELLKIMEHLYEILDYIDEGDDYEMKDYHDNALLKAFDQVVKKKRKEIANNVTKEIEEAKRESGVNLEQQFSKRPTINKIKRSFFGSSVKEQFTEPREMVEKSLINVNGTCLPDLHLGLALHQSIQNMDDRTTTTNLGLLVDKRKEGDITSLTDGNGTKAVLKDICTLIKIPNKEAERCNLQCQDPKKLLSALAEITTYYFGLKSYNSLREHVVGLPYYKPAEAKVSGETIIGGAKATKQFALGMAGVMGVDVLADGSLNFVSQIANSIGVSVPYVGAVAVAIIGLGAASAVLKDLNRMQREDFQSARLTVNSIYDHIKDDFLCKFDDYMNKVRELIEDNLSDLGGNSKILVNSYNAKVEVNILQDLLDDMTKKHAALSHEPI